MATNKVFGVPPGTIVIPATGDDAPGWGTHLTNTLNTIADYVNFQPFLYSLGTAYYSGVTPSITGTGVSSATGFYRVLNTTNGGIWLRISAKVVMSSSVSSVILTMSGVTSIYQHPQSVDVSVYKTGDPYATKAAGSIVPSGGGLIVVSNPTTFDELYLGGEFMLAFPADWQYR